MKIDIHTFTGPRETMTQLDIPASRLAGFAESVAHMAAHSEQDPTMTNYSLTIPIGWLHEAGSRGRT